MFLRFLAPVLLLTLMVLSGCADNSAPSREDLLAETDEACCPTPESVLARHAGESSDTGDHVPAEATSAMVAAGAALYLNHGCAVCHGQNGQGDGPVASTLQPAPRDFSDPTTYKNGRTVKSIAKSINWGVAGSESVMPAFPHIPGDDRVKIAFFINSLQDSQ